MPCSATAANESAWCGCFMKVEPSPSFVHRNLPVRASRAWTNTPMNGQTLAERLATRAGRQAFAGPSPLPSKASSPVAVPDALAIAQEPSLNLIDLDRALDALAAVDARKAKVVELRFFGGLSVDETADALHVSNDTIKRDWRMAKLWLLRQLEGKRDE